jgi:hypothetical protein
MCPKPIRGLSPGSNRALVIHTFTVSLEGMMVG